MTRQSDSQHSPLIAHIQSAIDLSDRDLAALRSLETASETVPSGRSLVREGKAFERAYILKDGWAIRHKDLSDGRRQILDFVLPGDFVGIEGSVQRRADHSVTTLTEVQMSPFPFDRVENLIREHPRLITALVWLGTRQRAIFAERLVSLGRRSAQERVAHLLVEIWRRLKIRGLSADRSFRMPVTQAVLADALGLSVVHVNRSLRQLTRAGLVEKGRETVSISDLTGLLEVAGFEGAYLNDGPAPDELVQFLERTRANRAATKQA